MKNPFASDPCTGSLPPFGDLSSFIYGLFGKFTPFKTNTRKDKRDAAVLPFQLKKTVVLVGMMGSGKTAIGTALAQRLGVPFLDSDAEIVAAANMTIAEIFARDGEPFFRKKETQVLDRLLRGAPAILSTGGGAFLQPGNRHLIAERGVSLWLRADLPLLWSRVRHKTTRPLLMTDDPYATLKSIFEERDPIYAKAQLSVEADASYSIETMTDRVIEALSSNATILEMI